MFVYLSPACRVARISTDEQTAKQTTIHDSYLHAVHYQEAYHAYPLVKIFGDIWTREDYKSSNNCNGNTINYVENLQIDASKRGVIDFKIQACNFGSNLLYKRSVVNDAGFAPSGWEVPSFTHYKEIHAMLTKYNLNSGLSFRSNPGSLGHSPLVSTDKNYFGLSFETSIFRTHVRPCISFLYSL